MNPEPLTVSQYLEIINATLETLPARVIGEVGQCTKAPSGHVYFTLKDKSGQAVLRAAIWKSNYAACGVNLEEGMEVVVSGTPNIYAPRGDLSFIAKTVELFGEGALKKAYEALKRTFAAEGLFDSERKRALPKFPEKIGIITSREGAVIHDFLSNIGPHGFVIKLIHSAVEGQEATMPLLSAIEAMKKEDLDILVIMRGGGSLESLQAFNNETLVRAAISFPVPVVAAIGHHKDEPLLAMAADAATSTPTAAAHLVSQPWIDAATWLGKTKIKLVNAHKELVEEANLQMKDVAGNISDEFTSLLHSARHTLELRMQNILANDPRRQFRLGFSITRANGKIVKSTENIHPGMTLHTEVVDGIITSETK